MTPNRVVTLRLRTADLAAAAAAERDSDHSTRQSLRNILGGQGWGQMDTVVWG